MDALLDLETAAGLLKLSPHTLERFRVEGRGPAYVKLGKRVLYRRDDLREYVELNIHRSTSETRRSPSRARASRKVA